MKLKRPRINEVKPRRDKAEILCSGYLCPLAESCHRFRKASDWFHKMSASGDSVNHNVVFQSPTFNEVTGKCVYFLQSITKDGRLR